MASLLCGCTSVCRADEKSGSASEKISSDAPRSERVPRSARRASVQKQMPASPKAKRHSKPESDDIDKELHTVLKTFNEQLMAPLKARRISDGEYEIDGRRVRLSWVPAYNGDRKELIVQEGCDSDADTTDTPLTTYLQQAADVAASLHGRSEGSPVVARVPADKRMTFVAPSKVSDDPSIERVRSMQVACEQARLRQHAAEAYERAEVERNSQRAMPTALVGSGSYGTDPATGMPLSRRNTPTTLQGGGSRGGSRAPTPPPAAPHQLMHVTSAGRAPTPPPKQAVAAGAPSRPPMPTLVTSTSVTVPADNSFNRGAPAPFGGIVVSTPPPTPGGSMHVAVASPDASSTALLRRATPPLGSLSRPPAQKVLAAPARANSPSVVARQNTPPAPLNRQNSPIGHQLASEQGAPGRGRSPSIKAAPVVVVQQPVQRQQTR
eukprot:TRINITY_DN68330_c0_g1_i1.p1 TRINITY_DN68330_c0_g1~~TRINITY_DN68330_c0_g1_i1.p1  ORF type:complete len:437 (-),score=59.65 TRINITY_DN68330_c0_g1_i1:74-1384(-)